MKLLAEALNVRASLNTKLGDLRNRIENNIYISNGNDPYEDVQELLNKALEVSNELENLVNVINQTNNNTKFESEIYSGTLSEALAHRDTLSQQIKTISQALDSIPSSKRSFFEDRTNGRVLLSVSVLRERKDEFATKLRKLDTDIQKANWSTDLVIK